MRDKMLRMLVGAVCLAVAVPTAGASAPLPCYPTITITSNTSLQYDYETSSNAGPCFDVKNGADLNLNGHSITCVGGNCAAAVSCDAANSLVRSSVSADGDHVDIGGGFSIGVKNCTDVKDLRVDGPATAISSMANDADLIDSNVLSNCATECIAATMLENTDYIRDNLISAYGANGIRIIGKSSSTGPLIDHNLIREFESGIKNSDI